MSQMHPDQSFKGKPIDPHTVRRVRAALNRYKGPRTAEESQEIVNKKVQAKIQKAKDETAEYLAWAAKVKAETVPSFRFPKDPKAGMMSNDEYVKKKVKDGIREMREKNTDYKAWIEDLKVKQDFKLQEKLQEKLKGDEDFAEAAARQNAERAERDAEIQRQVAETQAQYWTWLRSMKGEVAKRPCSVPPATKQDPNNSVEALTAKRKKEMGAVMTQQATEYKTWLESVQVKKFELPLITIVSQEEKDRRRERDKKRAEDFQKQSSVYIEGVRKMEQKHHERIMKRLKEKMDGDKAFNEAGAARDEIMAARREEEAQKRREIHQKTKQDLKDMYKQVKERPLWIEMAYNA
jgi:hypothetical protein